MKKVAIICNYELLPNRIGGMDYFFRAFNDKLKESNIETDWFFSGNKSHEYYNNFSMVLSRNDSVEDCFLVHSKKATYTHIFTHFTELCTSFYKKAKKIHGNVKIYAVDHNPRPMRGYPLLKRIKKRLKSSFYSPYIDLFIAVSSYSEKHLVADFGNRIQGKIRMIYNGLDSSVYQKKKETSGKSDFIVACHLREEKGVQHLIKAIHRIQNKLTDDFKVDIYGEGPMENELKSLVVDLNLDHLISFKGSIDNLHDVYWKYDYLVHPSLGETFCFSVVESLICNLPVVTTENNGNVLGLVKNNKNGFLFKEKDHQQLAMILLDINTGTISIDNTTHVPIPDFSLEAMVDKYYDLL